MANTYTQVHIQVVFAVKHRAAVISRTRQEDLNRYITGIVQSYKHKMLAINGMPDHIHLFFGQRPDQSTSELIQIVKASSSKWINEQGFCKGKFEWQRGFGAFSYSRKHVQRVCNYIQNQEQHHTRNTFQKEFRELLVESDVEFDERFLFHDPE